MKIMKYLTNKAIGAAALCLVLTAMTFSATAFAEDARVINFGVPSWPGVTVQSQVAEQLLEAIGYETKQLHASPAFIVRSLTTGRLDVYLGGWMPTEAGLIKPLAKKGDVKVLTSNISDALMGIAVPSYVWDAGVHSIADLNKHADKFQHTIYGIEPGTGFNKAVNKAISNNRANLGDWRMLPASTSIMLAQVGRAIDSHQWIAFLGWQPHWMNIKYDIKYLKPVGKHLIARQHSNVLTVVNPELVTDAPQAAKFLQEFQVDLHTMSTWILQYSLKKQKPQDVASQWISDNLDQVAGWLQGVKTLSGESAIEAVRAKYGD